MFGAEEEIWGQDVRLSELRWAGSNVLPMYCTVEYNSQARENNGVNDVFGPAWARVRTGLTDGGDGSGRSELRPLAR